MQHRSHMVPVRFFLYICVTFQREGSCGDSPICTNLFLFFPRIRFLKGSKSSPEMEGQKLPWSGQNNKPIYPAGRPLHAASSRPSHQRVTFFNTHCHLNNVSMTTLSKAAFCILCCKLQHRGKALMAQLQQGDTDCAFILASGQQALILLLPGGCFLFFF